MSKVLLSRQRTVWENPIHSDNSEMVTFESDGRVHQLYYQDWIDMGSPDKITTATEPGDLLNPDYMVDEITGDVT
jgi:protein tyrosine phosphatase